MSFTLSQKSPDETDDRYMIVNSIPIFMISLMLGFLMLKIFKKIFSVFRCLYLDGWQLTKIPRGTT